MTALVSTIPTRAGTASPGAPVAASDTITAGQLGAIGAVLEILNGNAAADNMTISDASITPTGGAAAAIAPSVPAGANRAFFIDRRQADLTTGLVTITHSVIATVSYKLYPIG